MSVTKNNEAAVPTKQKTLGFWETNNKSILVALAAVILITGGYFVYKYWFKLPENQKAVDAIAKAQQYFASDSLQKALNGDGQSAGFLKVISLSLIHI